MLTTNIDERTSASGSTRISGASIVRSVRSSLYPLVILYGLSIGPLVTYGQSPTSPAAEPAPDAFLVQVGEAETGGTAFEHVILTGRITLLAEGTPKTGTVRIVVSKYGQTQMNWQIEGKTYLEWNSSPGNMRTPCFVSLDRKIHNTPQGGCWNSVSWVMPTLHLPQSNVRHGLTVTQSSVIRANVPETALNLKNAGLSYKNNAFRAYIAVKSESVVYLDPSTLLPKSLKYHSDQNYPAQSNAAIQVFYDNYQKRDGLNIPFHIFRAINGKPLDEIVITKANLNKNKIAVSAGSARGTDEH